MTRSSPRKNELSDHSIHSLCSAVKVSPSHCWRSTVKSNDSLFHCWFSQREKSFL